MLTPKATYNEESPEREDRTDIPIEPANSSKGTMTKGRLLFQTQ